MGSCSLMCSLSILSMKRFWKEPVSGGCVDLARLVSFGGTNCHIYCWKHKCGVSEIAIQTTGHESFMPKFSLKCYTRVPTYNSFALVLHTYKVVLFVSIMPNDDGRKEQHIQIHLLPWSHSLLGYLWFACIGMMSLCSGMHN